ncbi:MAG: hypothetical protein IEMM0002_0928 [bacterium]|nr:MAG: hypothetical protein IEMM0002_0928 [bacterium]
METDIRGVGRMNIFKKGLLPALIASFIAGVALTTIFFPQKKDSESHVASYRNRIAVLEQRIAQRDQQLEAIDARERYFKKLQNELELSASALENDSKQLSQKRAELAGKRLARIQELEGKNESSFTASEDEFVLLRRLDFLLGGDPAGGSGRTFGKGEAG